MFKSLFSINFNLIRVKKRETVPTDSTIDKSSLYSSNKHVIGFKTNIRFIFDYKESEFDIGGAEVYLPDADITKLTDDEATLLREGKSIANSLNNVSSVAYVGHDLHVGILQNQILFPSCIGKLNDATKSLAFFKTPFQYGNGIEDSAHVIQSNISQTNKWNNATSDRFSDPGLVSLPRTMQQPLSQTCLQLSETGSDTLIEGCILDSPSPSATGNNELTTEDSFGFVNQEMNGIILLFENTLIPIL
ncbi:hypothetical protein INT47_010274 [Mucor saturninus]|uniref:Uncharacterized protein n=1 Tax=Mucor saturninus TaxID=64648 RepID=A0A8H7UNQ9_9FUNG|nr:hypothetical protein INT47_010274 [Mucor saturninus]